MDLLMEKKRNNDLTNAERKNIFNFNKKAEKGVSQSPRTIEERKRSLQPPEYGKAREGAVSLTCVHYSKSERDTLAGNHYGKGMRGAERGRLQRNSADDQQKFRIHYYVDEGNGVEPESGVGSYAHVTRLNNIYNWQQDPLNLWDKARKEYKDPADLVNFVENEIIKLGFDGLYAPKALGNQGVVVLLGEKHTKVPVLCIGVCSKYSQKSD